MFLSIFSGLFVANKRKQKLKAFQKKIAKNEKCLTSHDKALNLETLLNRIELYETRLIEAEKHLNVIHDEIDNHYNCLRKLREIITSNMRQ